MAMVQRCMHVDFEVENTTGRMRREAWSIVEDVGMLFVKFWDVVGGCLCDGDRCVRDVVFVYGYRTVWCMAEHADVAGGDQEKGGKKCWIWP